MLHIMRKYAQSLFIKILFGAIVVVFLFWGVGTIGRQGGDKVASVEGDIITLEEMGNAYQRLYESYRSIYGGQMNDQVLKSLGLKKQALENLINRRLLLLSADSLGLNVTQDQLIKAIKDVQGFQKEGKFDQETYQQMLGYLHMTPAGFEEGVKKDMLITALQDIIMSSAKVSEAEALDIFKEENEQVDLQFVSFASESIKDPELAQDKVEAYFAEHKEQYMTGEKIKVRYISFLAERYEKEVKITDKEVEDYYELNKKDIEQANKEKQVPIEKTKEDIRNNLTREGEKLKAYEAASKAHEDCAAAHALAEAVGDVRYTDFFSGNSQVSGIKPGDQVAFIKASFGLKEDEVAPLLELSDGYYILQVAERKPSEIPKIKDVEDRVRRDITAEEKNKAAREAAEQFLAEAKKEGVKFDEAAKKHEKEIQNTGLFKRGQPAPKIGYAPAIAEAVFSLSQKKPVYESVVESNGQFYVVRLTKKEPAKEDGFAAAKQDIEKKLLSQKRNIVFKQWLESLRGKYKVAYYRNNLLE
ncbi:MAG: SurA N-terminal domain-containing protein [Pseudomonadota bacterium]